MEEVFDSEAFRLRYDGETNACVFTMKTYGERDDFRTPVMHAIEIIRKHKSKHLIIEDSCEGLPDIKEDDLKWMKKVVLPKLQETSCEHIFFVVGDELAGTDCSEVPYSLFAEKFKTDKVVSEQFALMMIKNNCGAEVSSDIVSMTREQALEYLGLPANANDFMIDEKFWKLSKQYRGDNSPEGKQKIADLSAAYDIATGRRDERVQKAQQREMERKYFGKTGDELVLKLDVPCVDNRGNIARIRRTLSLNGLRKDLNAQMISVRGGLKLRAAFDQNACFRSVVHAGFVVVNTVAELDPRIAVDRRIKAVVTAFAFDRYLRINVSGVVLPRHDDLRPDVYGIVFVPFACRGVDCDSDVAFNVVLKRLSDRYFRIRIGFEFVRHRAGSCGQDCVNSTDKQRNRDNGCEYC